MRTTTIILAAALLAAACGPSAKTTPGSDDTTPSTTPPGGEGGLVDASTDTAPPPREISKDAKQDFVPAAEYYATQEKAGWTERSCRDAADRFRSVLGEHSGLIEASYMVGRSLQNCQLDEDAEAAYKATLKIDPKHAQSISNLGDIYFRNGKVDAARSSWEQALEVGPKLTAARNNLAFLLLEELRKTKDGANWTRIESSARDLLSNVLAVNQDSIRAYVLYGLIYMEGYEKNRSRLDLAKLLLDEGKKRKEDFAPLHNAYGLLNLLRNNNGQALESFQRAVSLDGKFVEARMNVGSMTLGFRKYDTAAEQFQAVLKLDPKNYDAMVGLGVAYRGLSKLDESEASYNQAKELDPKRGAAFYNLAVLYQDFRANAQADLKASQQSYEKARDLFRDAIERGDLTDEQRDDAKDNIKVLDKNIKQLEDVIKATAAAGAAGGGGDTPP